MSDIEMQQAEVINPERTFSEVICLRNYKGFKKNRVYAQLGWNNGSQVVRVSEEGDVLCLLCWNCGDNLVPLDEDSYEKSVFKYMYARKEPK